jgi:hypothetical protein
MNAKMHAACHWILATSGAICMAKDELTTLAGYAPNSSSITKIVGFILALAAFSNVFGKRIQEAAVVLSPAVDETTTPVDTAQRIVDKALPPASNVTVLPTAATLLSRLINKVRAPRKG